MFRPRSRRSRGLTVMSEIHPPQTTSPPSPSKEPEISGPDGGSELPVVPEKVEMTDETNITDIPPEIAENKDVAQAEARVLDTAEPAVKGKTQKKRGDEHTANDQAAAEDMKAKFTASKSSPLWDKYIKMTEEEDKDILEDWEGAVDVTLVFAALFSAISTGFLLESSKSLQPDPTVLAIRELTNVVQAGFQTTSGGSPSFDISPSGNSFNPSATTVWVNCLWFFSLGLSISVSLFAMLAKRWCYKSRSRHSGTSYERAIRRQEAWDALEKWKLELLIEQLPTVMHVALMAFFIGLVLYLSEVHLGAMVVTSIPIGLTILIYGALTVLPAWSPTFPMVTPFTRIMHAVSWYIGQFSSWVWPNLPKLASLWHADFYITAIHAVGPAFMCIITIFRPSKGRTNNPATQSPIESEQWVIIGCSKPVGKTEPYLPPEGQGQRYAFRALMWLLESSNDKALINDVVEYINTFPGVVLNSCANSQELYDASITVSGHFRRLKHDPIECHDLESTPFPRKCGRFMYLNDRPWFHYSSEQNSYDFWDSHNPFMNADEVEEEIQAIKKQRYSPKDCTLWLEQQAVKIVLGCTASSGFIMCRALFQFVSKALSIDEDHKGGVYPTLSWIFLNTAIDTSWDFWPSRETYGGRDDLRPAASCDSTLTLSYFIHSETRKEYSEWLKIVGLSGILHAPTKYFSEDIIPIHYSQEEFQPNSPSNHEYYTDIIRLIRATLTQVVNNTQTPPGGGRDPYVGKLPVYWKSETRLYEFDSLHYCFDALDHAAQCPWFASFHDQLEELKNMIPESRRGTPTQVPSDFKSADETAEGLVPDLPRVSTPADIHEIV